MEIDFEKIVDNDKAFEKLQKSQPESVEAMKDFVEEVPGIKVELQDSVDVAFD
jgi:hypothetical protein